MLQRNSSYTDTNNGIPTEAMALLFRGIILSQMGANYLCRGHDNSFVKLLLCDLLIDLLHFAAFLKNVSLANYLLICLVVICATTLSILMFYL